MANCSMLQNIQIACHKRGEKGNCGRRYFAGSLRFVALFCGSGLGLKLNSFIVRGKVFV